MRPACALVAGITPLVACTTLSAYSLDRSSNGYGEMLQARAECRRAGGEVVAPAGEPAGLKGYRCEFPREPEVRACRQWTMYESETDGLHELGFRCLDER
ncbi:MAG: hypothetical protein KA098_04890 [Phenylobacterium sp.]|nr:hypothetical protein [Phenylobacterium sp.]